MTADRVAERDRRAYNLLDKAWLAVCDVQDALRENDPLQRGLTQAGDALLEAKKAIRDRARDATD